MKMKQLTAGMIALVMSMSLPLTTYAADWYLEDGDVTVNAGDSGQTVTQGSDPAVSDDAPVITQRESSVETANTITINTSDNATANVTISNVNINASGAAVSTGGKGNVNIELDGTNTLKSGREHAGLEKSKDGKLTITDENGNGKLIATGGDYGAGIGGGSKGNGSNITITGGEVTAAGGTNGAGIGGGLQKNGEKITVSGDATIKVQGGPTNKWDGAGAGIGNGGSHNGAYNSWSLTPVNGAETEPDISNLTTGKIEYYAPGADMTKDEPTNTILGSEQPASPGETAAPAENTVQAPASEPAEKTNESTEYKAPVQKPICRVVDKDGKEIVFHTAQKDGVLAIATDSDFAMLTGNMKEIETLINRGVSRIILATKGRTSTFLLSDLLEKRAYGEIYHLIHDGEAVAFTVGDAMADVSEVLTK